MNTFLYRALFFFAGLWIFIACSDGLERDINYTIYSTHSSIELLEGEEFQLTASPTTQTFTWESTNSAVATVSSTGLVRGVSDGACFINIKSSEGLSRSIPVDVLKLIPLEGIEIFYKANHAPVESISLLLGKSIEVATKALPSNYNEKIPFNIIWESSDNDIVTIEEDGVITPVYFGKAEITVSVEDKPEIKKVIPVEVLENSITSIKVESHLILTLNKTHIVKPVLLPSDYKVLDPSLVWKSSDESIVKVTDGEIEPINLGSAIVTVSLKSNPAVFTDISITVGLNPALLNRSNWEVLDWNSCIIEEPRYATIGRTPEKVLDGDVATFWGSKWDAPKPLPYYFIFDMKKEFKIYSIVITKPNDTWRGNLKSGYIEISSDNVTWKKLSDWSISSNVPREHSFAQDGSHARYIRFVISDTFEYDKPASGPSSGARCDIAEFKVLGEE